MVESAAFDAYPWKGSPSFFRDVLDRLNEYAVVITDLEGDVQYWNDGATHVFGYRADEIRGRSIQLLFLPEDRANGVEIRERAQAATNGQLSDERWLLRHDGTRCFVTIMLQRIWVDGFDGFVRIMRDETHRPQIGELGHGAALVGTLAELHQWTMETKNRSPNDWATFVMKPLEDQTRTLANPEAAGGRTLGILLVEDHADTARLMARLLSRYRHHVTIAPTVADATEMVQTRRFDILISDIGLPDGTGFDVVRIAKAAQPIPSIALTGFGSPDDAARCAEAGFDEHLSKPVDFQKLEALLRKLGAAR